MPDVVVLGYDGSPSADAALEKTVAWCQGTSARVIVVFGYYISPLGGTPEGTLRGALEKIGDEAIAKALPALREAGIEAESVLVDAKPADAILRVAERENADLIVVGTVGEGPITGALLGSVVLRLIQRSKIPLLVVPTAD